MPVSRPTKLMAFRLSAEERRQLEEMADDGEWTMSDVIREALRLYGQEARQTEMEVQQALVRQGSER